MNRSQRKIVDLHDGWRPARLALTCVLGSLLASPALRADTIVLTGGEVIEGKIIAKSSTVLRVKTAQGERSIKLKDIKNILETKADLSDLSKDDFNALPEIAKQILNARFLYASGDYQAAIDRVTPHLDPKGTDANQMLLRWLVIDSHECLARFQEAEAQLKYVEENGSPRDAMRAKAYLQIFQDNPNKNLEKVGLRHSRYFQALTLDRELELRAKETNSLSDPTVMNAALREYCDQILTDDAVSVETFRRQLNTQETIRALEGKATAASVTKALPYRSLMDKVQRSLERVQAVLPGYADGYELELVRTEAEHILDVINFFFNRAVQNNPENVTPPFDAATGLLTREGREQWKQLCDDFLEQSKPAEDVMEYLLEKLDRYPKELRDTIIIYKEYKERLTQMRQLAIQRKESRTRV